MAIYNSVSAFAKPGRKRRKKNHSARNKTRERNRMMRELDDQTRDVIRSRDEVCQRCGSRENLQWSHIFTREYRAIRWDYLNSLLHCRDCHCWYTYHHGAGYVWFADKFPTRWNILSQIVRSGATKFTDADIRALWAERVQGERRT